MVVMKKVLFISNDMELSRTVRQSLDNMEITIIVAQSHLQGITILDKTHVDVIIAPIYETNMGGLEFVKFLRSKENDYVVSKKYIILYGDEDARDEVFSSNLAVDDFLLYPFYEPELIWRTKRGFYHITQIQNLFQKLSINNNTNTLTPEGFYGVLENEINRISRHTKNFSLLLITINNLEDILLNFGKDWQRWIEKKFLLYLKNNLRNYDRISKLDNNLRRISKLDNNIYVVFIPDANYDSLKGLDKRLKREYKSFFSELKKMGLTEDLKIVHRGISIKLVVDINKKDDIFAYVKEWLAKKRDEEPTKDELIMCTFSEFGPEIMYG